MLDPQRRMEPNRIKKTYEFKVKDTYGEKEIQLAENDREGQDLHQARERKLANHSCIVPVIPLLLCTYLYLVRIYRSPDAGYDGMVRGTSLGKTTLVLQSLVE